MYINTEKLININLIVLIITNKLISLYQALCAILIFGELNQIKSFLFMNDKRIHNIVMKHGHEYSVGLIRKKNTHDAKHIGQSCRRGDNIPNRHRLLKESLYSWKVQPAQKKFRITTRPSLFLPLPSLPSLPSNPLPSLPCLRRRVPKIQLGGLGSAVSSPAGSGAAAEPQPKLNLVAILP